MASARNHRRRSHRSYRKHLSAVLAMPKFMSRREFHLLMGRYY